MSVFGKLMRAKEQTKTPVDLRLYYTGDVHGSEQCFLKFVNAGKHYGVDALIMGGDITGKQMVPIIRYPDGHREADAMGGTRVATTEKEVADLEKLIRFNGMYPYHCDPDELTRLQDDEPYRMDVFLRLMVESIERWVSIADERLKGTGIACYVMPGNDDAYEIDAVLEQAEYVINPDNKVVSVKGYQMLSMAECNPTPWNSPREESEEDLERRLQGLINQLEPGKPVIFNLHAPPYQSSLDDAPALTDDLRPTMQGGQPVVEPVGSKAVRRAIEQVQPVISLHGHIHESRGQTHIGQTLCVNPGSAYHDGVLHGVIVELAGEEVCMHQLASG